MTLPILVAVSGAPWESDLVAALGRQRGAVTVVRRCVDVADLLAAAATGQARAALVAAELGRLDADVVARLLGSEVQPVGVLTPGSAEEAERLRRLGVTAQVDADRVDLIAAVVGGARGAEPTAAASANGSGPHSAEDRPPAAMATTRAPGRLLVVWGPTGAPGRSTVAVGLASELAALGADTMLLDADVYGGSVAQLLGMLDESSGLLAAARSANNGTLDAAALVGFARQLAPRLRVLTGLPRADRWPELRPAALSGVLSAARSIAAFVVADVGFSLEQDEELSFDTAAPRRNAATMLLLERADLVLAVGAADPVGLARLTRDLIDLTEAVPGVPVRVCVNRMRPSLGWSEAEVAETISRFTGVSRIGFLPADVEACDRAAVHGRLLSEVAPDSRLRRALRDVARGIAGLDAATNRRGRRRLVRAGGRPRAVAAHVRSA